MFSKRIKWVQIRFSHNPLVGQFFRYLVTGGFSFIVDFGLFVLCLYVFDWHYLLANLAGLIGGIVLNYGMSIVWVFRTCKRTFEKYKIAEFTLFTFVGFVGVGINQLLMFLMVGVFQWNEIISKMIAAAMVLMWNFGARKKILFQEKNFIIKGKNHG